MASSHVHLLTDTVDGLTIEVAQSAHAVTLLVTAGVHAVAVSVVADVGLDAIADAVMVTLREAARVEL